MILLIDIDDSRLKWAVFNKEKLTEQISYEYNSKNYAKVISKFVGTWSELEKSPSRVLIASLAKNMLKTTLDSEIWERWQVEPEYLTTSKFFQKLKNGYSNPGLLEVDRWLNLVGAYSINSQEKQTAFCVIGCGTTIALDAVDHTGKHLGGLIIPGFNLMEKSLLDNIKQIKSSESEVENVVQAPKQSAKNSFLANNTQHAVIGGIYYAIVSYIENIVADLVAIINSSSDYKVYITGLDSDKIIKMLNSEHKIGNHVINYELNNQLLWHGMLSLI